MSQTESPAMDCRDFHVTSPLTREDYHCRFVYLQTAISLRHSDTVDVKFRVNGAGVVVALPLTAWVGHPLTDERALQVAAAILREALERGEAVELLDLNPSVEEVVARASRV